MVIKLDINGTLMTFSDVAVPAAPSFGASIYYNGGIFYQKTTAGVIGTLTNSGGGSGSVTSVSVLTTIPGLTSSGSPIITEGTITVSGTLTPGGGGTGIGSYTAGDLLYATAAQTLAKLPIGSNDYALFSNGSAPYWGTLPAGGSSPWTTTGTLVHLNTGTNNVNVGGANDIAKFSITGDADEVQMRVRANATQSNALALFEDSSSNTQVSITANGDVTINEEGNDANFRVESDTDANALTVDGGNNNVGMGVATANASAKLEISSTAQGLLIPRMTTAQFAAISSKATGLMAWDTDLKAIVEYDGSAVRQIASRLPKRATMWHDEATVIAGNALVIGIGTSQIYNSYVYQSPSALNDEFEHECYIAAGTYTLSVLGVTSSDSGIITWYVDGGSVGTTDMYSGGASNVIKTVASVVIATSGYHAIRGKLASKNASASDYRAYLNKYWFK